jgi:NitT/TauT family transport system permease protein
VVCVVWSIGSRAGWWRELVLPPPESVYSELRTFVGTGQFWGDVGTTCGEVLISLLMGCFIGAVLGALFWWLPLLGRSLESYVVSFYSVPLIVLYPVMIVIVGITPWSLIILNTVVVTIPILLNVWIGLESTPPGYLKLGQSLRLTGFRLLFTLALPSASRQVAAGVQIAASVAISAAVGMEFLMAPHGMGFRVRFYYESLDSAKMLAYVVALFILAVVLVSGLGAAEKRVLRRLHVE